MAELFQKFAAYLTPPFAAVNVYTGAVGVAIGADVRTRARGQVSLLGAKLRVKGLLAWLTGIVLGRGAVTIDSADELGSRAAVTCCRA